MVSRRQTKISAPAPAEPLIEFEEELDPPSDIDKIRSILGEPDGQELVINLYRVGAGVNGRSAFLEEMSAENFSLSKIQSDHGAGIYKVLIYGPREDGRPGAKVLRTNRTIEIGAPARDAAPPAPSEVTELKSLVAALIEKINTPAPPPPAAPPAPTLADQMAHFKAFAEMMNAMRPPAPPPPAPAPSLLEQMDLLVKMQDFRAGLDAPPPAPEVGDNALLLEGIRTVGIALAASKPQGPQANASEEQPHPTMPPGPEQPPEDDMSLVLRIASNKLLDAAKSNEDIKKVANMVMAFASDEIILDLLEGDDWFENIKQFAPDASVHQAYFEGLRDEILSRYKDSVDGEPGEVSSPPANAQPRKPAKKS